jgi:hypothetical protein
LMGLAIAAFAPATSAKAFGDYPDGHYVLMSWASMSAAGAGGKTLTSEMISRQCAV